MQHAPLTFTVIVYDFLSTWTKIHFLLPVYLDVLSPTRNQNSFSNVDSLAVSAHSLFPAQLYFVVPILFLNPRVDPILLLCVCTIQRQVHAMHNACRVHTSREVIHARRILVRHIWRKVMYINLKIQFSHYRVFKLSLGINYIRLLSVIIKYIYKNFKFVPALLHTQIQKCCARI